MMINDRAKVRWLSMAEQMSSDDLHSSAVPFFFVFGIPLIWATSQTQGHCHPLLATSVRQQPQQAGHHLQALWLPSPLPLLVIAFGHHHQPPPSVAATTTANLNLRPHHWLSSPPPLPATIAPPPLAIAAPSSGIATASRHRGPPPMLPPTIAATASNHSYSLYIAIILLGSLLD
ncbi:hypothetical protein KFK09_022992 [Dendrobium nobile]|uniref:Uncharacterized protein n=1 Tax=Dendrobium nobile TaxID=94219 RepID=A0A8T3AJS7_DENNO|nr:hypothetical protein KFK09_022992 [Dendrobium nobile]